MTTSERRMAVFLMFLLGIVGGGGAIYALILRPYSERKKELARVEDELDKSEQDEIIGRKEVEKLRQDQKLSLPIDPDGGVSLARGEYEKELQYLLRLSKFDPRFISVAPKATEDKSTPKFTALEDKKKPIYVKIPVVIQATGSLENVVTFLWNFYRQPLLQNIKSFSLEKATSAPGMVRRNSQAAERQLTMNLQVEGLVLDNAEKRLSLLGVPTQASFVMGGPANFLVGQQGSEKGTPFPNLSGLATESRDYKQIAWKDMFFGNIRVEKERVTSIRGPDLALFIRFNGIMSNTTDGTTQATLFDDYNKYEYQIVKKTNGSFEVTTFWYSTLAKQKLSSSKYLEFGSEEEENLQHYEILGIDQIDRVLYYRDAEDKDLKQRSASNLALGGAGVVMSPGTVYRSKLGEKFYWAKDKDNRDGKVKPSVVRFLIFDGIIQLPQPESPKRY